MSADAAPNRVAPRLDWVEPLKAFAIVGILLNHLVEEFGPGPWFTNPSNSWPDFGTRIARFFPRDDALPVAAVRFLGWLGDSGPGVFILLSGFGLTLAALGRPAGARPLEFYRRRLVRLFPLYIAVHFLILGGALLVPGNDLTFAAPETLLSLAGLRFTAGLFFYISPSWWFVWLILQLYAAFPALLALLRRAGIARFLVVCLALTVASRGAGILFSDRLYYWMTGLFFGTRLAEFAVGMALAAWLARREPGTIGARPLPATRQVAAAGTLTYLLGLGASLTLAGSLVSNLFVTCGLTLLFHALWTGLVRRRATLASLVTRAGGVSYAVFLVHQPPLEWTTELLADRPSIHLAAAIAVLALSFPLAAALQRLVDEAPRALERDGVRRALRLAGALAAPALLLALLLAEPMGFGGPRIERGFAWLTACAVALLLRLELRGRAIEPERFVRRAALVAGVLHLFVLPPRWGDAAAAAGILIASLVWLLAWRGALRAAAWLGGAAAAGLLLAAGEVGLRRLAPREAGGWGERPALQSHPTRGYALRAGRTTRLRYNNYDYVLRTNSLGLASPEIAPERPSPDVFRLLLLGDAFTMPEGVPYERSWGAELQRRLETCLAPRPVQVVNAGVTGYGPVETLAETRDLAPLLRPDAVVYQFFVNEFAEQRLDARQRRRNIGLEPRTRSRRERRLASSQLLTRLRDGLGRGRERSLLEYYRTGPTPLYDDESLTLLRGYLGGIVRAAHAPLVVAFVPAAVAVTDPATLSYVPSGVRLDDTAHFDLGRPWRALRGVCDTLGLGCFDLSPALRAAKEPPVYFRDSWHWTERGHRVAAGAVLDELVAEDIVPARCATPLSR